MISGWHVDEIGALRSGAGSSDIDRACTRVLSCTVWVHIASGGVINKNGFRHFRESGERHRLWRKSRRALEPQRAAEDTQDAEKIGKILFHAEARGPRR